MGKKGTEMLGNSQVYRGSTGQGSCSDQSQWAAGEKSLLGWPPTNHNFCYSVSCVVSSHVKWAWSWSWLWCDASVSWGLMSVCVLVLSFCIASPWDTPSQNPAVTPKEAQLVMWRSHVDEIPDPRWHPLTGHPRNSQHHLASHVCEQISWAESSPSSRTPRGTEAGSQSLSCQQI